MSRGKNTYTFLEAAEKVLEAFGNKQPMHHGDIADIALRQGWVRTSSKVPKDSMKGVLVGSVKRAEVTNKASPFYRASDGYYGLYKWRDAGAVETEGIEPLRASLITIEFFRFQTGVRTLLFKMGLVEDIGSIAYDKRDDCPYGFHCKGVLMVDDAIRIGMAVEVTRRKQDILLPAVQKMRGGLDVHEQGLIVSTSNVSPDVMNASSKASRMPVSVIGGDTLASLMIKHDVNL